MNNELVNYILRIADDSFILGHRLSEWCGHGPILEEDIALTNLALDFIGQAHVLYDYCTEISPNISNADEFAFLRKEKEYTNLILLEQKNGDFAHTMIRQFLFDTYRLLFLEKLKNSSNDFLAAFADKTIIETKYHIKHSSDWILRLGDGTEFSHEKAQTALNVLFKFTPELFYMDEIDFNLIKQNIGVDLNEIKPIWINYITQHFNKATLQIPDNQNYSFIEGRKGKHSEAFGYILTDMQYMQRTYPNQQW